MTKKKVVDVKDAKKDAVENDFVGYSRQDLESLSIYELRDLSRVLALDRDDSSFHFKYIHFLKKIVLIQFITGSRKARLQVIEQKTVEMNAKLAETCRKANIKRDVSITNAKEMKKRQYERILKKYAVKNASQIQKLEVSDFVKSELNIALTYVKNFDGINA